MRNRRQQRRPRDSDCRVVVVGGGATAKNAVVAEGLDVGDVTELPRQEQAGLTFPDTFWLWWLLRVGPVLWRGSSILAPSFCAKGVFKHLDTIRDPPCSRALRGQGENTGLRLN